MAEKKVRTRVQSKHDVEKNWASATFVPLPGEIIIYDKDKGVNGGTHEKPRIKVGDGTTAVGSLPFVVDKEATDAAIAAAKATVVSASEQQNFTDEQKETARNNINAVDASLVVSEIHSNDAIPNGTALTNFATNNCVMAAVEQNLPDVDKRRARANIGAVSQAELNEAIANAGGGGGGFVSYSVTQDLTDEQKEVARNNIDAVDASLVVDNLVADKQLLTDHIPNGQAVQSFIEANAVSSAKTQSLSDSKKARARANIGAISQAELDEAIANAGGGNGNGGGGNFISYTETQALTVEQKQTARENINAVDASLVVYDYENESLSNGRIPSLGATVDLVMDWTRMCGVVNYESQSLSPEQKEVARNNIDAVDANLVVSSLSRNEQIPNGAALNEFIDDYTMHECVRADVQQYLFEDFQEIARSNIGAVSQAELNEAIANAGGFIGGGNFISYTETQALADEQKATARGNINAVDASLVTDNLNSNEKIPNGAGLTNFLSESLHHFDVVSYNSKQTTTNKQKATARDNIEVDGGKWELLYTIEGDSETSLWEYTQFADGSPLKLTAVSAVVIQDVAEAEKSYGHLYAYCDAKSTQFPAAIYSHFTKNSAPTKPGTQRAYGVVEQYRGQYRAYSVGMAEKGNEVMRYTPYMQGKHTTSDHPYIDHIKIHKQTGVFSTGNKIEVYGVRYYE